MFVSASRWPLLTTQTNYSSVVMPQKSALPQALQTLLPPSQSSRPEVAEMEAGQLTSSGQTIEVRGLNGGALWCWGWWLFVDLTEFQQPKAFN